MKRAGLLTVGLIAWMGAGFATGAWSDPPSPRQPTGMTVREILANPVRDQMVAVRGQILGHLKDNEFLLEDGTGQIVIDGGPLWHHRLDLPNGRPISLVGEVGVGPPRAVESPGRSDRRRAPEIAIYSVVLPGGREIVVRGPGRAAERSPRGD